MSELIVCIGREKVSPWRGRRDLSFFLFLFISPSLHGCSEWLVKIWYSSRNQGMIKTWVEWKSEIWEERGRSCCCHGNGVDAKAMELFGFLLSLSLLLAFSRMQIWMTPWLTFFSRFSCPGGNFYGGIFHFLYVWPYLGLRIPFHLIYYSSLSLDDSTFFYGDSYYYYCRERERVAGNIKGLDVMEGTERKELES